MNSREGIAYAHGALICYSLLCGCSFFYNEGARPKRCGAEIDDSITQPLAEVHCPAEAREERSALTSRIEESSCSTYHLQNVSHACPLSPDPKGMRRCWPQPRIPTLPPDERGNQTSRGESCVHGTQPLREENSKVYVEHVPMLVEMT